MKHLSLRGNMRKHTLDMSHILKAGDGVDERYFGILSIASELILR